MPSRPCLDSAIQHLSASGALVWEVCGRLFLAVHALELGIRRFTNAHNRFEKCVECPTFHVAVDC